MTSSRRFGTRALRRPLTTDDVGFYRRAYVPSTGIDAEGVADVITLILNSPGFLYQVESGGDSIGVASTNCHPSS
jgi:hypothetical protein